MVTLLFLEKLFAQVNSNMSSQKHETQYDDLEVEAQLCRLFDSAKPRLPKRTNPGSVVRTQRMDPVADSCGFALVEPFRPLFLGNVSQSILPHVSVQVPPTVFSWRIDGEVKMLSKLYAHVILCICIHLYTYIL